MENNHESAFNMHWIHLSNFLSKLLATLDRSYKEDSWDLPAMSCWLSHLYFLRRVLSIFNMSELCVWNEPEIN